MVESLRKMHKQHKEENDRHADILERQVMFHMFQVLQHFDKDFSGTISGQEIENLIKYV